MPQRGIYVTNKVKGYGRVHRTPDGAPRNKARLILNDRSEAHYLILGRCLAKAMASQR